MSGPERIVTFLWDGEEWAFDLEDVVEVATARSVTPVPGTGSGVMGIASWRGRTLPVLLPRGLKESTATPDLKSRLLVLRHPAPFAVPLDEPGRVATIGAGTFPPPEMTGEGEDRTLRAVVHVDGRPVRILDPRVLAANGTPARGPGARTAKEER